MELRDEVKSQFDKCHRLAKKYYDKGDVARAKVEYLKCGRLLEHLAQLSPPQRKEELLSRSQKFREIAEGLQEGNITVYTSGVKPKEREANIIGDKEQREDRARRSGMSRRIAWIVVWSVAGCASPTIDTWADRGLTGVTHAKANNLAAAAFQLAVWEIVLENDANPYNVDSDQGAFYATSGPSAVEQANEWLAELASLEFVDIGLRVLTNPDKQDFVVRIPGFGSPEIPEPLTMLAVGLGVAGIGRYVRRRTKDA